MSEVPASARLVKQSLLMSGGWQARFFVWEKAAVLLTSQHCSK